MNREQETAEEKLPFWTKHKTNPLFCGLLHDLQHRHKTPAAMESSASGLEAAFFRTFFVKYPEWCLTFFGNGCIVNVTMVSMVA